MKKILITLSLAVFPMILLHSAPAHELVRNGDFRNVLNAWNVPAVLKDLPFSTEHQAVVMHPWLDHVAYPGGVVVSQALNLNVTPGQALNVSVDLRTRWPAPAGNSFALYLEYLDASGTRHRELALNPSNATISDASWQTFATSHAVPPDRVKLVGIALDKEGPGEILATRVSLKAASSGDPVPELLSILPPAAAYGEEVVLSGDYFGQTQGQVLVGGSKTGIDIHSWDSNRIVISMSDPSIGGAVVVEADGVRSWQSRRVRITSPYFSLDAKPTVSDSFGPQASTHPAVLLGQDFIGAAFVRFFNGYQTTQGISLSLIGVEAIEVGEGDVLTDWSVDFGTNPVFGSGGSIFSLSTDGWPAGLYRVSIEADDGMVAAQRATFMLKVLEVTELEWLFEASSLEGTNFTTQGLKDIFPVLIDSEGLELWGFNGELRLTSSHPHLIETFLDPGIWGGFSLLVHDSAENVTLTATLPDNRTFTTQVSATIPDDPRFVSTGFTYPTMSNLPGKDTEENLNMLYFNFSSAPTRVGANWSASLESDGFVGSGANRGWTFYATPYLLPGKYVISVRGEFSGEWHHASRILTVVNDPATALIEGRIVQHAGGMEHHGIYGTMELYDDASGDLVESHESSGASGSLDSYMIARVTPGSYRLHWIADDMGEGDDGGLSQWYPNTSTFADALTVVLTAGDTMSGVDFLLSSEPEEREAPRFLGSPSAASETSTFSIGINAINGVRYDLQKSTNMEENTWITIDSAWGWEGEAALFDRNMIEDRAFYRVIVH